MKKSMPSEKVDIHSGPEKAKERAKEKEKAKETRKALEKEQTKERAKEKAPRQAVGSVKARTMPRNAQKASPKAKARPHQPMGSVRRKAGIRGASQKSLYDIFLGCQLLWKTRNKYHHYRSLFLYRTDSMHWDLYRLYPGVLTSLMGT